MKMNYTLCALLFALCMTIADAGAYTIDEGGTKKEPRVISGLELKGEGISVQADHVIIEDCVVEDAGAGVYSKGARNVVVRDCVFRNCGYGLIMRGEDWTVENVEVDTVVLRDTDGDGKGDGDADYTRGFGDGITLRDCYFHGGLVLEAEGRPHVDGFQSFSNQWEPGIKNLTIENCRIFDVHQGIMITDDGDRDSKNITIRNSVIADSTNGALIHDVQNITIEHTLFHNLKYHGALLKKTATGKVVQCVFWRTGSYYGGSEGGTAEGLGNVLWPAPKKRAQSDIARDPALKKIDGIYYFTKMTPDYVKKALPWLEALPEED